MFTWIPLHREAIAKLLELHRAGGEPLDTLRAMKAADLRLIGLDDKDAAGRVVPLADVDPFTFFAAFNRGLSDDRRRENWAFVKKRWELQSAVPGDFTGIPTLHNLSSRFFPPATERSPEHISQLWTLAEQAATSPIDKLDPGLFNRCVALPQVSTSNLTIGLFWINPACYLAADNKSVALGTRHGVSAPSQVYASYRSWLEQMTRTFGSDYPSISHRAHLEATGQATGQSIGGAIGGEQIPAEEMERLWERFHERIDDFTDFANPGEAFVRHETGYKHQLLERFQRDLGRERLGEMIARGAGQEASKAVQRVLSSNIASFRAWNPTLGETDRQCCDTLSTYLAATEGPYSGPETTQPIFEAATRLGLKPAWDAVSLLLFALRPDAYFPIKIRHYRELAEEIGQPLPKGAPNALKLDAVIRFGRLLRAALAPQSPKDWVDVQSFLWVVCPNSYAKDAEQVEEDQPTALTRDEETGSTGRNYWWLNANPKIWDFDQMPIGHRQSYTSHNERGNKRQRYRWFQEARPGDLIVGYVTSPQREIVAICKVTQGLHEGAAGEEFEFEKVEHLPRPIPYAELEAIAGLTESEPLRNNQGSLFRLTEAEFEIVRDLIDESVVPAIDAPPRFTREEAMRGLFLAPERFDSMLIALREKKNVILQGAPGVGKTYVADRLAYALMEQEDHSRLVRIQFHQSYSYEDFIQGFRPTAKGSFEMKYGVFHEFCRRAQRDPDPSRPWVFVIDEINRGNLSKIFGELMMLLEPDKRGRKWALPLAYAQGAADRFFVPENVYVIGMMNTADRSLAMVDYALRRRFRFLTLEPEFERPSFREYLLEAGASEALVSRIVARMTDLNRQIGDDTKNLGPGFRLGHSYFCPRSDIRPDESWYRRVIESEIVPMLEEYWFDKPEKVAEERAALLA